MTVSSRDETRAAATCAAPGCASVVAEHATGRPGRFCSPACRARAYRSRQARQEPVLAEVQLGSTSSKGRSGGQVWMVVLRRGTDSLIVAVGLPRSAAERLAQRMNEMICVSIS